MRQMKFWIMLSAVYIMAVNGCGIKEDRSECPCRLMLDMSRVHVGSGDSLELVIVADSNRVYSATVDSASYREDFVIEVPRVSLRLVAWCGGEGMTGRDGLVIPLGRSCPEVYTHMSDIDADAEIVYDTLMMKKNHCVVDLNFKNGSGEGMKLKIRGEVCGYDQYGNPIEGEFSAVAGRDGTDVGSLSRIVLPRQSGGGLVLDVEDKNGRLRSFPLSDYIEATGYDWNAPDLRDLLITIDLVHTTVSLTVAGWDEEFFFDIVI